MPLARAIILAAFLTLSGCTLLAPDLPLTPEPARHGWGQRCIPDPDGSPRCEGEAIPVDWEGAR